MFYLRHNKRIHESCVKTTMMIVVLVVIAAYAWSLIYDKPYPQSVSPLQPRHQSESQQSQQKNNQKKMWNTFKVNNKDTRTMSLTPYWCPYCQLWTCSTPFSSDSIADFEHTFVCWKNKKGESIKSKLGKIFYHAGAKTGEKGFSIH